MFHFAENPWAANCTPANHQPVYSGLIKKCPCFFRSVDVTVSNDWNRHAGIVLHFANHRPVSLAGVQLTACAAMNGKCDNSGILQPFGDFNNNFVVFVPAQTGFCSNRYFHCFHNGFGHPLHFFRIEQHSGTGTVADNFLHRAAVIDVDKIGLTFFSDFCCPNHRINVVAVYLDSHRTIEIEQRHFLLCFLNVADQRFRRNKFGVHHIGTVFFTHVPKRFIRHIFHWRQKQRHLPQIYSSDLHNLYFYNFTQQEQPVISIAPNKVQ